MADHHNKAKQLVEKVSEQKDRGSDIGAKQTFTRHWREVVPEMPPRIAIVLVRLNHKTALKVMERIRDGRAPELALQGSLEEGLQVKLARGKQERLGNIPVRYLTTLRQLGNKALRAYRPQLLEVTRDQQGKISVVAIELLRPELTVCSSCQKTFYDPEAVNCPSCRKKRRRRGPQQFEHPPVAFHEALEEMIKEDD